VQAELEGDAYLPKFNDDDWQETVVEEYTSDESNDHNVIFSILERA